MRISDAIKTILKNEHKTQKELSEMLGYPRITTLNTSLRRGNMTTKKIIEICDALDYEIVLRPKSGTNKLERTVILDEYDEGESQ